MEVLEKEKTRLSALQQWIGKKLGGELDGAVASGEGPLGEYEVCKKEILSLASQSNETLEASQAEVVQSLQVQEQKIEAERQRQINWKTENERRRHNYVPVIFELLKQLAQKKMLGNLFNEAKERKAKKDAEKDSNKKAATMSSGGDVQMQPQ